jgi:hypothetical protein
MYETSLSYILHDIDVMTEDIDLELVSICKSPTV